jgi:flagellar basal-body rod protein FlgB
MLKMTSFKRLARFLLIYPERQGLCKDTALRESVDIRKLQMSKTNSIIAIIEAGIKAEALRQKAIANNVANLETPGYRRIDVKFEELLAKSLDSSGSVDLSKLEPQIYRPRQTPVKSNGNDVTLENEVGAMIKNSLRYTTFIRLLNKKYKAIELAMNVGSR